ncbi:MAG: hypothetical protein ACFCU8_03240 [Thermosynechococcaceae cyanobacterium]
MRLEFVPVEEFFFALTLSVRLLEELDNPEVLKQMRSHLQDQYGQSSTVAAAQDNTFNYVFRLFGYTQSSDPFLLISISDWNGKLRLSSDYGWALNEDRKPTRTEQFAQRPEFAQQLKVFLQDQFQVPLAMPPTAELKLPGD